MSVAVFEELYAQKLVDEPGCWNTCNGGFCCSNNHPDFDFDFMTTQGTDIVYLPREYQWANKTRATFENTVGRYPSVLELDLGDFSIGIVYSNCKLLGACKGVIDKPLLCRLYPFLPVYRYSGEFERTIPSSAFDVTFDAIGQSSPCTVLNQKKYDAEFGSGSFYRSVDTYVLFYLRCASHLAVTMTAAIKDNAKLLSLSGKQFWKRWELLHLGGRFLADDLLTEKILDEYQSAQSADPEFSLAEEKALLKSIRETD